MPFYATGQSSSHHFYIFTTISEVSWFAYVFIERNVFHTRFYRQISCFSWDFIMAQISSG